MTTITVSTDFAVGSVFNALHSSYLPFKIRCESGEAAVFYVDRPRDEVECIVEGYCVANKAPGKRVYDVVS